VNESTGVNPRMSRFRAARKVYSEAWLTTRLGPDTFAIDVEGGQLDAVLAPLASDRVTTIVGFTERSGRETLYNSAAILHRGAAALFVPTNSGMPQAKGAGRRGQEWRHRTGD
jgi:hypothetical protein